MTWGWIARGLAVAIAVAGVIDPAVTTLRPARPTVSVLTEPDHNSGDRALADRVARRLEPRFSVVRTLLPETAAAVASGARLPDIASDIRVPAFAVLPNSHAPQVAIEHLIAPGRATPDSRIPVTADLTIGHAKGSTLDVSLSTDGVMVDHATRSIGSDDERVSVTMSAIPTREGPMAVRVSAGLTAAGSSVARADTLVSVERHAWRVLVFDRRPSWLSTFVRRAVEEDARFAVVAHTVTSPAASSSTRGAPVTLADATALAGFDVVVVGAPDALSDQDVSGLETFMRRRAGSVVLLMDQTAGSPYQRLTSVSKWSEQTNAAFIPLDVTGVAGEHLLATELAWPSALPVAAEPLVTRPGAPGEARPAEAIVWQIPAGPGRLIVSGVLDGWRARKQSGSSFDLFWRRTLAAAAEASPPPVQITIDRPVARPSESFIAHVRVRDAALDLSQSARTLRVSALLEDGNSSSQSIRAWPSGRPGEFQIEARVPRQPGTYRLTVSSGDDRATSPFIVLADAIAPVADAQGLMAAWATSRSGIAVPEERLDDAIAALASALHVPSQRQTWHPMRSPWWILPFAFGLGVEWWLRRTRGQA